MTAPASWDNLDTRGTRTGAGVFAHLLLLVVAAFLGVFVWWAHGAALDEVARGDGAVVPSGEVRAVQAREGGILAGIDVVEGAVVEKGQPLLRIDNVAAAANLRALRTKSLSLEAAVARLRAEAEGLDAIEFPRAVLTEAPATADNERGLFEARRVQLDRQIGVLHDQVRQKQQEIAELTAKTGQNQRALELAEQELDLLRPLVERGISPKLEFLRVQQKVQELATLTESVKLAIPRTRASLAESERRIGERRAAFRAEAQRERNDRQAELDALKETIAAGAGRVARTELRAPVRGIVDRVVVDAIGGAVRPGETLVEIVPLEDTLRIEAKVRPSDRARLYPGQEATVRISAYDFTRHGGVRAVLTDIGADVVPGDDGESYYRIGLRAEAGSLGPGRPIVPGMAAMAEIVTGRRTVLEYLLTPVAMARYSALRER